MIQDCSRGDMFFADLSPIIGSEQGGDACVVIQNNIGNQHSPTVIVAAITSRIATKTKLPVHVELPYGLGLEKKTLSRS
jgi:mRNA interferase MazF